jgi:uncharacterized protein
LELLAAEIWGAPWAYCSQVATYPPDVTSFAEARDHIASTQALLARIDIDDTKLSEVKRMDFGQGMSIELSGLAYVDDFLMPNFYFHLTTAYDIMRMAGAPIGKRDYMMHLVPLIKQQG